MALRSYGSGLYGWGRLSEKWGYDFNGTAIICDSVVLVVDPVEPTLEELDALKALGTAFQIILLNADHERYSAELAEALNAPVFVHEADAPKLNNPNVQSFQDGHCFAKQWRVIQLHGHKTEGECALFSETRQSLLLGDALIGDPVTGLRFVPPQKVRDRQLAMQSICALQELRFDTLILSDGFVLPQGGRDALCGFVDPIGSV